MNTVKLKIWESIAYNYTGIAERENGNKWWYKNGKYYREDGPAIIWANGDKEWWLDGKWVWDSSRRSKIVLRNIIILSKDPHPEYPMAKVWKYVDEYGIQEQIIIPEMEEWFTE